MGAVRQGACCVAVLDNDVFYNDDPHIAMGDNVRVVQIVSVFPHSVVFLVPTLS